MEWQSVQFRSIHSRLRDVLVILLISVDVRPGLELISQTKIHSLDFSSLTYLPSWAWEMSLDTKHSRGDDFQYPCLTESCALSGTDREVDTWGTSVSMNKKTCRSLLHLTTLRWKQANV